jgi:hypothetical protein
MNEAGEIQHRRAIESEFISDQLCGRFGIDAFGREMELGDGVGAVTRAVRVRD